MIPWKNEACCGEKVIYESDIWRNLGPRNVKRRIWSMDDIWVWPRYCPSNGENTIGPWDKLGYPTLRHNQVVKLAKIRSSLVFSCEFHPVNGYIVMRLIHSQGLTWGMGPPFIAGFVGWETMGKWGVSSKWWMWREGFKGVDHLLLWVEDKTPGESWGSNHWWGYGEQWHETLEKRHVHNCGPDEIEKTEAT